MACCRTALLMVFMQVASPEILAPGMLLVKDSARNALKRGVTMHE